MKTPSPSPANTNWVGKQRCEVWAGVCGCQRAGRKEGEKELCILKPKLCYIYTPCNTPQNSSLPQLLFAICYFLYDAEQPEKSNFRVVRVQTKSTVLLLLCGVFSGCTPVTRESQLLWEKTAQNCYVFHLNQLQSWNFSMLPKILFYLYIFKCNCIGKEKPKTMTKDNPPVPTNPKSAKHRKEPGPATVQLQPMELPCCISLYPLLE